MVRQSTESPNTLYTKDTTESTNERELFNWTKVNPIYVNTKCLGLITLFITKYISTRLL